MAHFTADQIAAMTGGVARMARLVSLDFASGTLRLWDGVGDLVVSGEVWSGAGDLVSVADMPAGADFFASKCTITLSGEPAQRREILAAARNQQGEVRGRRVTIGFVVLGADFQPIGDPATVWAGVMDRFRFQRAVQSGAILLDCETPFVSRQRPRFGYYTHEDQIRRYPNDNGLRFVAAASEKTLKWPTR